MNGFVHRLYHSLLLLWVVILTLPLVGCRQGAKPSELPTSSVATNLEGDLSSRPSQTPASHDSLSFKNVASALGIDFVARNGEEHLQYSILETIGSGVGWIDFDNDGNLDLFLAGGGTLESAQVSGLPSALYRSADQRFVDVGRHLRIELAKLYSHGVFNADFDNDGFTDILLTGFGGIQLLHNCGDGTFEDVTPNELQRAGLWTTGAAWGDFDGDGVLDLYLTQYVDWSFANHPSCFLGKQTVCAPIRFSGLQDHLLLARGDGSFSSDTPEAVSKGKGLASLAADLDLDGDLDVYVANDTTPNFLLENIGNGEFEEIGIESGTAFGEQASSDGSMGIDVGDFDLDGLPDLWVTNFEGQSFALYRNLGNLMFEHVSAQKGLTTVGPEYVGFGTLFFDFDLDGDEDIACVNGHVTDASTNSPLRQRPLFWLNTNGKFSNIAPGSAGYWSAEHRGRGLASVDFDNDGDLDLAISHVEEPFVLLRNDVLPPVDDSPDANWLSVRLIGRSSSREPVGARVSVSSGGTRQLRMLKSGTSYLATHDPRLHFGLPDITAVDIQVHWPSGAIQKLKGVAPNQHLELIEPEH